MALVAFVPREPTTSAFLPRRTAATPKRPVGYLVSGALKVEFPFNPLESTIGGYASDWASVDRTGRAPLIRYKGAKLRTMSYDITLAKLDGSNVEAIIGGLRDIGKAGDPVYFYYNSALEIGPWRMTGCTINILERDQWNAVTEAKVALEFIEASDVTISQKSTLPAATGPVSGGAVKTPTVPPAATARSYTVKSGDSLWTIAKAYYGDPEKWRKIADANPAIRNPNLIYPGQVLAIPA